MSKPIWVIGAGGHAKVVISTILAANKKVAGILDDNQEKWSNTILGFPIPISGPIEKLKNDKSARAIIAVGDNVIRKKIASRLPNVKWETVIHPFSWIDPSVTIGEGSVVFAGSVIQPGTKIGRHVIINTSASADHDNVIDDFVQLCPGVHLSGLVHIKEGVFMGTNSTVIQGKTVGEWTIVGSGAVIIEDQPPYSIVVGVPAKVKKMREKLDLL
ncbi:MAG: acetyltransferase [Promethearchaeota archaeon]